MHNDIRKPAHAPVRSLIAVEPRFRILFCIVLVTGASALASLALACATPFAAYAVVACAVLPLPPALAVVAAAWLVNQAIGFCLLGYPFDANTVLWGFAIGAAALAATAASAVVLRWLSRSGYAAAVFSALAAAFAAYEAVLFACTPVLGGSGAFTLAIMARLGALNTAWTIGLMACCAAAAGLHGMRQRALAS